MAYSADAVVGENEGVRMDHVSVGCTGLNLFIEK